MNYTCPMHPQIRQDSPGALRLRTRHFAALAHVLLLALASAASARPALEAPVFDVENIVTRVRLTADRMEYRGLITHEANRGVFELYRSADPKPQTLLIESQGGSADAGIELGTRAPCTAEVYFSERLNAT